MPWWNVWGGGVKKQRFFPPKTSYKLGTGVKQGKQVGFFRRETIFRYGRIQIITWKNTKMLIKTETNDLSVMYNLSTDDIPNDL